MWFFFLIGFKNDQETDVCWWRISDRIGFVGQIRCKWSRDTHKKKQKTVEYLHDESTTFDRRLFRCPRWHVISPGQERFSVCSIKRNSATIAPTLMFIILINNYFNDIKWLLNQFSKVFLSFPLILDRFNSILLC